jgi:hypothetical protein
MHRCVRCGEEKAFEDFPRNRSKAAKRNSECKACHVQMRTELQLRWNERNKELVNAELAKGCLICKRTEVPLHFHHHTERRNGKRTTISDLASKRSPMRLQEELSKCVVLCVPHHQDVHRGRFAVEDYLVRR